MEELLARIVALEQKVAELSNSNSNANSNVNANFKTTINNICITESDLELVYKTSMKTQIIRIISDVNKNESCLKWKKIMYKYEGDWVKLTDDDITYMIEHVENLLISLYKQISNALNPDEFFEKAEIIYGLDLKKHFKKIKAELLQSL